MNSKAKVSLLCSPPISASPPPRDDATLKCSGILRDFLAKQPSHETAGPFPGLISEPSRSTVPEGIRLGWDASASPHPDKGQEGTEPNAIHASHHRGQRMRACGGIGGEMGSEWKREARSEHGAPGPNSCLAYLVLAQPGQTRTPAHNQKAASASRIMERSLDAESEPPAKGCFKCEKGGFRALPFIFLNEMLEKVAGFGLNTNMITYLTKKYHLSTVTSQTMLFVWSAASNFAPIPGAVLADMYLGRFMAVALGSGMVFLWLSATIPGARPPPCNNASEHCAPPGASHLAWLLSGFAFLSLGAGGVRPCSMAFGADQFSRHPKERRSRILQAYFNAYYASIGVAFSIAVTAIVYLQDNVGWSVGFAVPMGLMLLSTVSFLLGSGLYIKEKGKRLMFSGIGAAAAAAIRNHRARLPAKTGDGVYHHLKDCKLTVPTDQLSIVEG
nr:unnamed protein product [Digitaria exilis]